LVDVVHWNPQRPVLPGLLGRLVPIRRPVNNFGDLLGPALVKRMLDARGIAPDTAATSSRLLSIGSILSLARTDDHVWGTGINGKSRHVPLNASRLTIHSVRGPLTRAALIQQGFEVPEVYGDPGILVSRYWPGTHGQVSTEPLVVPNFHDFPSFRGRPNVLNPQADLDTCIATIASSPMVVGSSLHAVILAESFGIPARAVRSAVEPTFKYEDYYEGTGRANVKIAATVNEAIDLGGVSLSGLPLEAVESAFPAHLWSPSPSREDAH
jgi:pyruvyltransferase